jgi:hypothetical protein
MSVTPGPTQSQPASGLSPHAQALWRSAAELRRRADETAARIPAPVQALGEAR